MEGRFRRLWKDCRSSDACCRALQDSSGFGRQSCLGEMLGSPATPGPGLVLRGGVATGSSPLVSGLQEASPLWGVAAWSSLELPLVLEERIPFVCSLNCEYTEGDSYLRIKL